MKNCQNCQQPFTIAPDDFSFYEKMGVPAPTWCPECRLIRRLAWRNERSLYKRECARCKASQISIFSPEANRVVYCNSCWWGDQWDSLEYGIDYDPTKPFFEQINQLMQRVPTQPLWTVPSTMVNSPYNNLAAYLKNCYMVFHADYSEDCAYAAGLKHCKDSIDITMLQRSELCYECVNVIKGYKNFFCVDCEDSRSIFFSKGLVNCSDCFGCVNLRGKNYHIFNEPYSREGYFEKLKTLDFSSYANVQDLKKQTQEFRQKFPVRYMRGRRNLNSSGDYVYDSKNTLFSYETFGAENCKYCQFASTKPTSDSYDYTEWGLGVELMYEALLSGEGVANIKFSAHTVANCRDIEYSHTMIGSSDCFGCVGLRNKQYCILNRQYSPDEYADLISKIKSQMSKMGEYGEFFPMEMSPFPYHESTAHEYFPRPITVMLKDKPHTPTISWKDIPDRIQEVQDSILDEIIFCQTWYENPAMAGLHNCTKAFRLTGQELQFYRKNGLPVPRKCHNTRHHERIKFRAPIRFYHRSCMCTQSHPQHNDQCPNEFETSYSPDRPEIVYCEPCYQQEVL